MGRGENGRFLPGASGNPGGRPKGSLSKRLAEAAAKKSKLRGRSGMTREEVIAEEVVAAAETGDLDAVKFYADRTEGKVAETLNLHAPDTAFPGVSDGDLVARVVAADKQQRRESRKAGAGKEDLH